MCPAKQPDFVEDTMQVPVKRTRELSNKLALLPKPDLVLLRRIYEKPNDIEVKKIISSALLSDYSIHELRLALAALDGSHELPLSEKPIGYENAKAWKPVEETTPLPPQRIPAPSDESPPLPSAKAAQEISDILISIPFDDFQWLLIHYNDIHDLRSRLIIIKNRLYRYQWEDVAATIAAMVLILNVLILSPPVPQVSTILVLFLGWIWWQNFLIVEANAVISSTVSPFILNAVRRAAI